MIGSIPIINLKKSVAAQLFQENRREYEKRVASIVEQSWQTFSAEDGGDEGNSNSDETAAATS